LDKRTIIVYRSRADKLHASNYADGNGVELERAKTGRLCCNKRWAHLDVRDLPKSREKFIKIYIYIYVFIDFIIRFLRTNSILYPSFYTERFIQHVYTILTLLKDYN